MASRTLTTPMLYGQRQEDYQQLLTARQPQNKTSPLHQMSHWVPSIDFKIKRKEKHVNKSQQINKDGYNIAEVFFLSLFLDEIQNMQPSNVIPQHIEYFKLKESEKKIEGRWSL